MATGFGKIQCITCGKERATAKCAGCLQDFCFNHLTDHRQELNKQLGEIEVTRDLFRQTLIHQTTEPQKHPLIQQINKWEQDSIHKIRQTAEETRLLTVTYINEYITQLEQKLAELTNQLQQSREEDDIIETDLQNWKEKFTQLTEQFNKPSHIIIQQNTIPLINKLSVDLPGERIPDNSIMESSKSEKPIRIQNITIEWIRNGITVAGGNGIGVRLNQLSDPWSVCVNDDQTIYVADRSNHRIVEWKNNATSGQIVAGGNGQGCETNQLSRPLDVIIDKDNDCLIICDYGNKRVVRWPRQNGTTGETIISNVSCWGLTMDSNGHLYVSDVNKHEVRRYGKGDTNGTVVAGGNGPGKRFDQLNGPYYICVDEDHSVYVSDCNNHRIMKWVKDAKKGVVVAGGRDYGKELTELSGPYGVIVDQLCTVYVADCNNNRVICWSKGAKQGNVIVGGNGSGKKVNQFNSPSGLSLDRQNNLYVVDNSNHRVQKFNFKPKYN